MDDRYRRALHGSGPLPDWWGEVLPSWEDVTNFAEMALGDLPDRLAWEHLEALHKFLMENKLERPPALTEWIEQVHAGVIERPTWRGRRGNSLRDSVIGMVSWWMAYGGVPVADVDEEIAAELFKDVETIKRIRLRQWRKYGLPV